MSKFSKAITELFGNIISGKNDLSDRMIICYLARAIFEECLLVMLKHSGHHAPLEGTNNHLTLNDGVLALKPYFNPIRINYFFELKEFSSMGLHSCQQITLQQMRRVFTALQGFLEECTLFLKTGITTPLKLEESREIPQPKPLSEPASQPKLLPEPASQPKLLSEPASQPKLLPEPASQPKLCDWSR